MRCVLKNCLALTLTCVASNLAVADVVSLTLAGNSGSTFDFDAASATYTTTLADGFAGIELTFTAFVSAGTGNLNAASSNFGVDATGAGDTTNALDAGLGAETLRIAFDGQGLASSITLTQLTIGGFAGSDAGTLTIGANSTSISATTTTTIPVHTNLDGGFLDIIYTGPGAANGFSVNGVQLSVTAVPEASSFIFGGLLCAALSLKFGGRHFLARFAS